MRQLVDTYAVDIDTAEDLASVEIDVVGRYAGAPRLKQAVALALPDHSPKC